MVALLMILSYLRWSFLFNYYCCFWYLGNYMLPSTNAELTVIKVAKWEAGYALASTLESMYRTVQTYFRLMIRIWHDTMMRI